MSLSWSSLFALIEFVICCSQVLSSVLKVKSSVSRGFVEVDGAEVVVVVEVVVVTVVAGVVDVVVG